LPSPPRRWRGGRGAGTESGLRRWPVGSRAEEAVDGGRARGVRASICGAAAGGPRRDRATP
ncbi:hypothetical protein Q9966_011919, partial [Columba livia]